MDDLAGQIDEVLTVLSGFKATQNCMNKEFNARLDALEIRATRDRSCVRDCDDLEGDRASLRDDHSARGDNGDVREARDNCRYTRGDKDNRRPQRHDREDDFT